MSTDGLYTATPPTVTDGLSAPIAIDNKRNVMVTMVSGGAAVGASNPLPTTSSPSGNTYKTVAASQSTQILGTTGAIGDFLARLIITPSTTAPGVVTLIDNATTIMPWLGGTVGADLKPFVIEIGAVSASGAWKVTTGANVSVVAVGRFT